MRSTRRGHVIRLVGVGAGVSLAGCLGNLKSSDGSDADIEYDSFQAGTATSRPLWTEDERRTGYVTVIESLSDGWRIHEPSSISEDEDFASWIQETDFENSVVVGIQTAAPNACYEELEIAGVDVSKTSVPARSDEGDETEELEAITGAATAVEDATTGEDCAQTATYPVTYVRVTGEDLPSEAAVTITDGWGETSEVSSTEGLIDLDELPGHVRPPGDPPAVPAALECDEEFRRLSSNFDDGVAWGETDDPELAMRVTNPQYDGDSDDVGKALTFERGDDVRIRLRNVSDRTVNLGNNRKYTLELLTEAGWQNIRGTDPGTPTGYTDEARGRDPGEGYDWGFTLTEADLEQDHAGGGRLRVCPDLQPGRYRFVYWSTGGAKPIAVAFDLVG